LVATRAEFLEEGGVFGVGGEVVELVGVYLEVEELFEGRLGIDVAGVGVGLGAHADGVGDPAFVTVGVVVEKVAAPLGVRVFRQLGQVEAVVTPCRLPWGGNQRIGRAGEMKKNCIPFLLVAAVIQAALPAAADPARAKPVEVSHYETSRFLAGMAPVSDPLLVELAEDRNWKRHAQILDDAWEGFEKGRLSKVRQWSATRIPAASKSEDTLFYMFSGPDFLFADAFYPGASTYVFCGVEPVGPIPDLAKLRRNQLSRELLALRSSIDSILSFSFFLTKEMKTDLRNHALSGTLPIISIFMARAGKVITDIEYVGLDEQGALHPVDQPKIGDGITAPGVKFSFRDRASRRIRTLYYFSTDISDGGFDKSGFRHFCLDLGQGNGLVKSASYLMHKSYFSQVRGFLLENTNTLVQDPSGIPVKYFMDERWNLRPYGNYLGPISLFSEYSQPKLYELYRKGKPEKLDFGVGYRHRIGQSGLVVAERRDRRVAAAKPKPPKKPRAAPQPKPPTKPKAAATTDDAPKTRNPVKTKDAPKAMTVTQGSPKAAPVLKAIPVADADPVPDEKKNEPVAQ
jgi:hypothetical protein